MKTWWPGTELNDSAGRGFSNLLIAQWTQRTGRTQKTVLVCVLCAFFLDSKRLRLTVTSSDQSARSWRLARHDFACGNPESVAALAGVTDFEVPATMCIRFFGICCVARSRHTGGQYCFPRAHGNLCQFGGGERWKKQKSCAILSMRRYSRPW